MQAGIGFGSTCPPGREKPAWKKADGSAPWQDPHPRLLLCNVMTGTFSRNRDKLPPLLFHKSRAASAPPPPPPPPMTLQIIQAVTTWTSSLGPCLPRGPRGSLALFPRGCPSSSPRPDALPKVWVQFCNPALTTAVLIPVCKRRQYDCYRKVPNKLQGVASTVLGEPGDGGEAPPARRAALPSSDTVRKRTPSAPTRELT